MISDFPSGSFFLIISEDSASHIEDRFIEAPSTVSKPVPIPPEPCLCRNSDGLLNPSCVSASPVSSVQCSKFEVRSSKFAKEHPTIDLQRVVLSLYFGGPRCFTVPGGIGPNRSNRRFPLNSADTSATFIGHSECLSKVPIGIDASQREEDIP
jgi:hypothetical protein